MRLFSRKKNPFVLALFAALICTAPVSYGLTATDHNLALPYDLPAHDAVLAQESYSCPPPPAAPQQDLIFSSVYKKTDPHRATVDKKARSEYREETAEMQRMENDMLHMSNNYLQTGNPAKAQCVLSWLHEWADNAGLLGVTNNMGIAIRQWTLSSFSSAYAQIRDEPSLNPREKKRVETWLRHCAKTVILDYPPDATEGRKLNNHLYWAAWAVTMTGIALDDDQLYEWGIARAKNILNNQFEDDGTLPLEMARGKKALHYHIFAALPLIMLAEAGTRNGDNLYKMNDGILHLFVKQIVDGMKDPSFYAKKAAAKQTSISKLHPGHYAWMEAYNRRFPDPAIEKQLKKHRPVFLRRTGGDMTFLYR